MKIMVTGATGFIGRHLVQKIVETGEDLICLVRDVERASKCPWLKEVRLLQSDIESKPPKLDIDEDTILIHLAWGGLPNYSSAFHYEKNLPEHYNYLKSMLQQGLRHLYVMGTCLEYGLKEGPLATETVTEPTTAYGYAKDALNKQLQLKQKELNFTLQWGRLFYVYGEGQSEKSILPLLDKAILNQDKEFKMSGGEQLRDYTSVEDAINQILRIIKHRRNGTFNICSGTPISIRKLIEQRIKEKHSDIQLKLGHYDYAEYEPMSFWGAK